MNTVATSNKKQINQISSSSHVSVFWGKDTGLQKVVLEKRVMFVFISCLFMFLLCNHFQAFKLGEKEEEEPVR